MCTPLATLWYTRCPVPTGLGIAIQHGWLASLNINFDQIHVIGVG